ncbi:MAG: S9 family peptidase [Deltaproteobacteria bacterium]|nr:MAG: S9 family peptidase [Deltaproteobacteria bacterium]
MRPIPLVSTAGSILVLLASGCAHHGATTAEPPAAEAAARHGAEGANGVVVDPPRLASDEPHGFSVLDLLDMRRIGEVVPSPDGHKVAFVVRVVDLEANRLRSDLYVFDVGRKETVRLTRTVDDEYAPAFSADGKTLYHLVAGEAGGEIRALDLASKTTKTVRTLPLAVSGLAVVQDKGFLVAADLFAECNLACTKARLDEKATKDSATAYEGLFVRHWDTWKDGRRSHLLFVPEGDGSVVDLSGALDADVPSKPFGGFEEIAVAPSGDRVVFAARVAGREEAWSTNFDLYEVSLDGGSPVRITNNPAWDTHPVFSPDGKQLAYLAMARPGYEADRFRLVLHDLERKETRTLTDAWDRSVREFVFAPDGKAIYATAQHLGQVGLFRIDVADGKVTELWADGTVGSLGVLGDRLVFTKNDLAHPSELFALPMGAEPKTPPEPWTHLNDDRLANVKMGGFEQFTFRGARGDTVHGYIVRPADFDAGKRYPLAFLVHGGPQGSFGNNFHYRWNPQVYAGAGYVAVMIDFHGSTGYGQAFTDAIRADWGGKPLEDLKKGLAYVEKTYPFVDGKRVCALGASYGGFMMNWIAGNWPDRFRCLVNHDGVFDMRSMYYSTEELWFPEWEQKGPYFANPKQHEKHNPVRFVDRWKTPMLVIHGSRDYRVPIEQGLAAFTALVRRGIEARFVHFPDENHWVLKPKNAVRWHEEVLGWLDRHLKAGTPETR